MSVRPVGATDAVFRRDFVEGVEKIHWTQLRAVDADWRARFKTDLDFFGFVWGFFRGDSPLPHGFIRRVGRIF
jgi:hypothetical protein